MTLNKCVPFSVVVVMLLGCNSKSGGDDVGAGDAGDAGDDAAFQERVDNTTEYGSYPSCLQTTRLDQERDFCPGWVLGVQDSSDACDTCVCYSDCARDQDCLPALGAANDPLCRLDTCVLPCGSSDDCPSGMTCVDGDPNNLDVARSCVWQTDDEFYCGATNFEDPCAPFSDQVSCEQAGSELMPNHACAWVVESIHQLPSDTCEPVATRERCMGVYELQGEDCGNRPRCSGSDRSAYWDDVGAGTVHLVAFEGCRQPADWESYEACDGNSAAGSLCDCLCDAS